MGSAVVLQCTLYCMLRVCASRGRLKALLKFRRGLTNVHFSPDAQHGLFEMRVVAEVDPKLGLADVEKGSVGEQRLGLDSLYDPNFELRDNGQPHPSDHLGTESIAYPI